MTIKIAQNSCLLIEDYDADLIIDCLTHEIDEMEKLESSGRLFDRKLARLTKIRSIFEIMSEGELDEDFIDGGYQE